MTVRPTVILPHTPVAVKLPRIAITMGDPAGVGPELCLRLLGENRVHAVCEPRVLGDRAVLERVARHLQWPAPEHLLIHDLRNIEAMAVVPGCVSASCGQAAFEAVNAAIDEALGGRAHALVTGPLNKEALHAAGIPYLGHTEILADRTHSQSVCMMLTSEAITCALVTGHVGYNGVPALLSTERIVETIELTAQTMTRLRHRKPRLLVCGLNPHAGEQGLFGDREEERIIAPAVAVAVARGHDVRGPLPPDTAFLPKYRQQADAYICMYHDQGLIPLKALAFEDAVNITLGLPIVRTSVDHGTAFDIAWQGVADVSSFVKAVELAAQLCQH